MSYAEQEAAGNRLVARIKELEAEIERQAQAYKLVYDAGAMLIGERDGLKAEVERLKEYWTATTEAHGVQFQRAEKAEAEVARLTTDLRLSSDREFLVQQRKAGFEAEVERLTKDLEAAVRATSYNVLTEEVRRLNLVLARRPPLKDLNAEVAQLGAENARLREALDTYAQYSARGEVTLVSGALARAALDAAGQSQD